MREAEFNEEFSGIFDTMAPMIMKLLAEDRENEARGMVLRIRHQLSRMPDTIHRDRYLTEIKTRWGHLLKSPNLKLVKGEGDT
jgi:hypothetical protein